MAHTTLKSGYASLVERLNRFPQGAPPADVLYRILSLLFSEKEARLVALLPIKPFTAEQAARAWHLSVDEARLVLDALADRAILLDVEDPNGRLTYFLPPPMAGFFEFSMMRIRSDVDQKLLAELYYQYLNVEEDFIKALFYKGETQLGRTFVQEADALGREQPARAGLRAGKRGREDRLAPRHRRLLLQAQDAARRQGLRRAEGQLHDLQRHRLRRSSPTALRGRST